MKKLKVIQIIDSLEAGGAEMMAVNIANALSKQGVESHLCTTRKEGALATKLNKEVNYFFLEKKRTIDINAFIKLYKYIKRNNISIIQAHSSSYFIGFLMKLSLPSCKLIWHDHYGNSEILVKRRLFPLKFCSNLFNAIISVNERLLIWTQNNLKVSKVVVLPNFAKLSSNTSENKTFLKGVNGKRIICLANLRPQKDHINLLEAFKIVVKEHRDWTLHLVGLDLIDDYSNSIKDFIKKEDLYNKVFVYGSKNNIGNILNQVTIGVLSSKSEGLPVALLEYGLAGLPVVVTNVGDCSKVVKNNVNGYLVPPNDSELLASKIMLYIENEQQRTNMGKNLREFVLDNFSEEAYLKQLLVLYLSS